MTNILKIFFLVFTIVSLACNSTQANSSTTKNTSKSSIKEQTQTVSSAPTPQPEGYKGTIIHSSAEDDCEYVILLDGKSSVMLDPINLTGNYKKHGTKIWFTFRSMKMPNRCKKANPISITDIEERSN
tara:strand:+ start:235 stop:618 length:384 start_codon:yes stop_codon:yes gene_type:complete